MKAVWKSSISGNEYADDYELREGETIDQLEARVKADFSEFNAQQREEYRGKAMLKLFVRLDSPEDELLR